MKKQMLHFLTASALLALPVLAQPAPPPPGGPGMANPPMATPYGYREAEKAQREIRRAQYLAGIVVQAPLKGEADALLRRAQQEYQAQAYFRAKELAEAAGKIYEALRFQEVAPRQAVPYGPKDRKKAYEAPYRAQEAIARAEYEAGYYRVNRPLVGRLLSEAKGLLASGSDLARAEAARRLAEAARHLIKAERGF